MQRRIEKLERQRPERAVIFLWQDDPVPDDIDDRALIIRFVWRDQTVREKRPDKVVS